VIKGDEDVVSSTPTSAQEEEEETSVAPPAEQKTVSYELTETEREKIADSVKIQKSVLSTSFKTGLKVGDAYVFAFGINNINPLPTKFRLAIFFVDAKSSSGGMSNNIVADKDTMVDWLSRTDFSTISLDQQEQIIVPLVVEIKAERAPGQKTLPGSYNFEVWAEYEDRPNHWERYSNEKHRLSVKVVE